MSALSKHHKHFYLIPYMKNVVNVFFECMKGNIIFNLTENPDLTSADDADIYN